MPTTTSFLTVHNTKLDNINITTERYTLKHLFNIAILTFYRFVFCKFCHICDVNISFIYNFANDCRNERGTNTHVHDSKRRYIPHIRKPQYMHEHE